MGGLIKTMPLTAVTFLLCAFSVIGIPPLGGFFSKFMVIMGTVEANQIPVAGVALFVAVLTMFYLFRLFNAMFLGEAKSTSPEGTKSMLFVVVVLAGLSLLGGIFVAYPMKVVNVATLEIMKWLQ
jgi:formate hydrogenlyase subunit 3/multisubunit Na+/H+ antiporter MnhD subunit